MRTCSIVMTSALLLGGCDSTQLRVEQYGAMRDVLRDGHTEARLRLTDAVGRPHAVGVGALEGLEGEITILDGRVWVARVDGDELRVTGPGPVVGDHATLLTLAHVPAWQAITLEASAYGAGLETLIRDAAGTHGLDVTRPFPFLIEGASIGVDLHVINGFCPVAADPATVGVEPWRRSDLHAEDVVIVGFFAPAAAGSMTHHGTAIHAHAVLTLDDRTITAHADRVSISGAVTLRVPIAN
ncbi:MAG: hypothetical protein HKO59_14885 [Phycisphaerales bacterium]|nr:hypothetical protein [Phycisphaerae bacterium]NNM27244.1 hypothetical protein [Phycisphaerales bacterium]